MSELPRVLLVEDNEDDYEAAVRSLIFDKFFRGRQHRFETKGTGMGLAIAKGIVVAHGGSISASNRPGGGAVISLSLPSSSPGNE